MSVVAVLQKQIRELEAELKRLKRWPDYFAWEREMEKVQADNTRLEAELEAAEKVFCMAESSEQKALQEVDLLRAGLEYLVDEYEWCKCGASKYAAELLTPKPACAEKRK